jgi:hypothetical protein
MSELYKAAKYEQAVRALQQLPLDQCIRALAQRVADGNKPAYQVWTENASKEDF